MTTANVRTAIAKQVGRVRRRLFIRDLIAETIRGTVISLLLTTGWLLAEPHVWRDAPSWMRWAVLGGTLGMAVLYAIVRAVMLRPDATHAALWLDDAFGLRERVTTSLALSNDDAASSAGHALLDDALAKVKDLRVSERFPIQLGWSTWLVPSSAAALALVALFYNPALPVAQGTTETKAIAAAEKKEIEKKLEALTKQKRDPAVEANRVKSEELKRLEAKLEEIARQPRDNTQQLRERVKDLTPLEDEIKKLERERTEKARMMQQQLQMKDQLLPNETARDGPAKDFMKALSEGDMEKGREELDKLAKKLANNQLNEQEKQQLGQQLNDLQKKLGDLAQQKQKEELLKKLGQDGKLDPEALEREMAQLRKENQNLKDLQKLANQMSQCQQCMKAGDMQNAQKALNQAADQMKDMARDSKELDDLRDALQNLRDCKECMAKNCDEDGMNKGGNKEGDKEGNNGGRMLENPTPGNSDFSQNNGGIGQGQRPDGEQGKTRPYDAKQDARFNPKGTKQFDGFVPGQAFKKKAGVDMAADIKQAAQEAPEAIETQRIPKAARDMAKGYFKNLGGQAEGEKKEEKKDEKKEEKK